MGVRPVRWLPAVAARVAVAELRRADPLDRDRLDATGPRSVGRLGRRRFLVVVGRRHRSRSRGDRT
eukprot:SAG22_NODE_205_length_15308_cov_20.539023_8_plen_66_part_00